MAENGWLIDAQQVYRMIEDLDLDSRDMKKAFKSSLSKSSNLIRKQAGTNLKQVSYGDGALKNADFLSKAININVFRSGRGAAVGLFDNRKDTIIYKKAKYRNPAFLLRFINAGTDIRMVRRRGHFKNKLPINRGKMEARPFFSEAINQKYDEAQDILGDNIEKAIIKLANKKRQ